ncbi:hypothetical protein M0R45_025283 [Rubus argutus]|uniref:Uncharacterized protein n=1 Tax=Rubus argutus TaxID=59490 RepID=A0AAW1WVM1_RUBAR
MASPSTTTVLCRVSITAMPIPLYLTASTKPKSNHLCLPFLTNNQTNIYSPRHLHHHGHFITSPSQTSRPHLQFVSINQLYPLLFPSTTHHNQTHASPLPPKLAAPNHKNPDHAAPSFTDHLFCSVHARA